MSTYKVTHNVLLLCGRVPQAYQVNSLFVRFRYPRGLCTSRGNPASSGLGKNSKSARYLLGAGFATLGAITGYLAGYGRQDEPSKDSKVQLDDTAHKAKPLIPDLPESVKYLLIGGGTSSFAAFRSIRANDPRAKVIVISEEDYEPYMKPPLSKELWFAENDLVKDFKFRQWNGRERTVFYEHPEFYSSLKKLSETDTGGVSIVKGYKVVDLNTVQKKATLDNGQTISYEKCLIATGGRPKTTEVFKKASPDINERLILYHNLDDFRRLRKISETNSTITIVGGGFLGSELACALGRRSQLVQKPLRVYNVFPDNGNLSNVLPEYLSKWTTEKIRKEGAEIIPNADIKSVKKLGDKINLELTTGQTLETDYVVLCAGLEPNVDLAKSANLEVDNEYGGFRVNSELQARSDIWVSGDVSCFYDVKLGRRRIEHHDNAILSGRLAGENMATGNGKHFWHQSMFWSDLGPDVGFEAIGLIDSSLPTVGVFAKPSPQPESEAQSRKPSEGSAEITQNQPELRPPSENDLYDRGVLFYLKDQVVVGVLLWNIFDKMAIARRIINEGKAYEDMSELAKLFYIKPTLPEDMPEDNPQ